MKRRIIMLIFMISLVLLLAACGGKNDNQPNITDDFIPEAAETVTIAPIEPIEGLTDDRTLVSENELTNEAVDDTALEPDNPAAEKAPPLVEIVAEPLGQMIDDYLSQGLFWGTVLVAQGDDIILHNAYGDIYGSGIRNTINTQFYIASVTKQFTGAAILQLESEGKLAVSDTLNNFFPDYDGLENVTVQDLLVMQGGFGDFLLTMDHYGGATIEGIESYIFTGWGGKRSENFSYSNSDYWLLGRIIEQVSGMTVEQYFAEKLLIPAGMANSGIAGSPTARINDANDWRAAMACTAAGLVSTAWDLSLWLDAYFGGKLFDESMLNQIRRGHYNYGWYFRDNSIWLHAGGVGYYSSIVMYDSESETKIIILANAGMSAPRALEIIEDVLRR